MHWLSGIVRPVTLIRSTRLSDAVSADVLLASETFQHTGSFKFRAGYNLASKVPQSHLITASSGNFGQALAYACKLLSKKCHVVMPDTSSKTKIAAVKEFGGIVDLVDVKLKSRAQRVLELADQFPEAYLASAYDDDFVIEGNSTLGLELLEPCKGFDAIIAPVGGGGLTSGLIKAFAPTGIKVIGAEPALANDAARSLQTGELVRNEGEPGTLADGARTLSLGNRNWPILKSGIDSILEVSEENIAKGVRKLFLLANLKCEPTGALTVGALLQNPEEFRGKQVCCVISGGNVDTEVYVKLIEGTT